MTPILRRILHGAGSVLALIGIVFVGLRLHTYLLDLDLSRITLLVWSFIAMFSLIYSSANFLLALAWWHLLRYLGCSPTRLGTIRVYGISQLAKYVPGNIFHLAGRQALGMAEGISAGILVKSTIWELGLIASAGTLSIWLILPLLLPNLFPDFPEIKGVLLMLVNTALLVGFLYRTFDRQPTLSFIWQIFFLLLSGAIFVALLELIADTKGLGAQHWLMIGGAYIAAWLVGLVTPGAPAGVGVREMILLFLLKDIVVDRDLLIAILLGRLVTVVGDLIFFFVTYSIPARFCALKKSDV
ncbi:hypothetical protein LMG23992_02985 [Cupriavidus laharis]|uniref:Uncharacterized protein n=2 Tax=Cupriavidus laharis TaxID=151654 RepID=A0ABM8X6F9_9BURK|nr:hypothetical protein LMG23992_02985 [Cupriavidus laharis]